MLVRRSIWDELAGFDPALDVVDGALDFCYRARAAGWRVEIVPSAIVETLSSSLEAALGEVSLARIVREEAKARAHRVLSYLAAIVSPFRGISPTPLRNWPARSPEFCVLAPSPRPVARLPEPPHNRLIVVDSL
jgi:hypothetical protein